MKAELGLLTVKCEGSDKHQSLERPTAMCFLDLVHSLRKEVRIMCLVSRHPIISVSEAIWRLKNEGRMEVGPGLSVFSLAVFSLCALQGLGKIVTSIPISCAKEYRDGLEWYKS